jgi:hypothetical protein
MKNALEFAYVANKLNKTYELQQIASDGHGQLFSGDRRRLVGHRLLS